MTSMSTASLCFGFDGVGELSKGECTSGVGERVGAAFALPFPFAGFLVAVFFDVGFLVAVFAVLRVARRFRFASGAVVTSKVSSVLSSSTTSIGASHWPGSPADLA